MNDKKPDRLEIRTLGQFSVKCGPVVLSDQALRSNRLWELLKYLLTCRGTRLPVDTALETLWPDQSYEDARSAFRIWVYRIRKLLDKSPCQGEGGLSITFSHGCYSLEAGKNCWMDTLEIDTFYNRALDLAPSNSAEAIQAYRQLIDLYKGDYLPEITGSWVLPTRHRYQRIFLKSVLELCSHYFREKEYDQAARVCEQAVKAAPLAEELHICYLRALIGARRLREAQNHYEYITTFYYLEMGAKPSDELKHIYRQINGGQDKGEPQPEAPEMETENRKEGAAFLPPEHFFQSNRPPESTPMYMPPFLGMLTISYPGPDLPAAVSAEAAALLKEVISISTRSGDVYTQLKETQFLLLLPGLSPELGKQVLQRISERFQQTAKSPELALQYEVQPLGDQKPL